MIARVRVLEYERTGQVRDRASARARNSDGELREKGKLLFIGVEITGFLYMFKSQQENTNDESETWIIQYQ